MEEATEFQIVADATRQEREEKRGLRSGRSVTLRPVLTAAAAAAAATRRRCRHHKGAGPVLRLATVGAPSQPDVELICRGARPFGAGVSCLRIRYRLVPVTRPRANLLPISAHRRSDGRRRRLMDAGRRSRNGRAGAGGATTAGARCGRRRAGQRRAVPDRGQGRPIVSRYTMLHQRLVEDRRTGLFDGERAGTAEAPPSATSRLA